MNRRRFTLFSAGLLLLAWLGGCQTAKVPTDYEPLVARFFIEAKTNEASIALQLPVSGVSIAVNPRPVIVEYDIVNAEMARVEMGACLMVQLTSAAARDLYRFSVSNQGRRLVLSLNDAPFGVRRIEQAMTEGAILIFVEVPDAELPQLVNRLKRTSADIAAAAAKK